MRNGQPENDNFVGLDRHRFYIRVRDPAATTPTVRASWRTLLGNLRDDDAPASQQVTLTAMSPPLNAFVSKALMLATDDTDANWDDPLSDRAAPNGGARTRGQSNDRLPTGADRRFRSRDLSAGKWVRGRADCAAIFRRRPDFRCCVKAAA